MDAKATHLEECEMNNQCPFHRAGDDCGIYHEHNGQFIGYPQRCRPGKQSLASAACQQEAKRQQETISQLQNWAHKLAKDELQRQAGEKEEHLERQFPNYCRTGLPDRRVNEPPKEWVRRGAPAIFGSKHIRSSGGRRKTDR